MKIRTTNETTHTIVLAPYRDKLESFFEANNLQYRFLRKKDWPEDLEKVFVLEGHRVTHGLDCVESHMLPEDIRELVLRLWHPDRYGEAEEL